MHSELELVCISSTVFDHCGIIFCGRSIISDISVLKLKVDKCSRQDNLFMKKVFIFLFICVFINVPTLPTTPPPTVFCCSMGSSSTVTSTWAVKRRAVAGGTTKLSLLCWVSSAWS